MLAIRVLICFALARENIEIDDGEIFLGNSRSEIREPFQRNGNLMIYQAAKCLGHEER